jgi:hypothetical protein
MTNRGDTSLGRQSAVQIVDFRYSLFAVVVVSRMVLYFTINTMAQYSSNLIRISLSCTFFSTLHKLDQAIPAAYELRKGGVKTDGLTKPGCGIPDG